MTVTDHRDAGSPPGDIFDRWVNPTGKPTKARALALWTIVAGLPLSALLLFTTRDVDMEWRSAPSHFWLVLSVAVVNIVLGVVASEAATRRDDARTFFVSMTLLTTAGFVGLHALATPGILLKDVTEGFSLAARVGLLVAAGFAALSAVDPGRRVVRFLTRHHRWVRAALGVTLAAWAVASLARVPLLDRPLPPDDALPLFRLLALGGVALYGFVALRSDRVHPSTRSWPASARRG